MSAIAAPFGGTGCQPNNRGRQDKSPEQSSGLSA